MERMEQWLAWAMELQALAQAGLYYTKDPFDRERFERVRAISAEMVAGQAGLPVETVRGLFCNEVGYQTPKLDTRAAILWEGRILLVRERDGLWSLPGGWVDVGSSVGENAAREAREEAGVEVAPERIVAVLDRAKNNPGVSPYGVCKVFVLCRLLGGAFRPNSETTQSAWFAEEALPPLSEARNTPEQVRMCFRAAEDPNWRVLFD